IVQAAGRCNREGRTEGGGRVVIFRPEEGRTPPGEYRSAVDETERLLNREEVDLHDPGIFREYFARLYQDVPTDALGIQDLRRELDYPGVAENFRLIPDDTTPVVVRYAEKDARKEAERTRTLSRIERERVLLPGDHRRLQPYVVGLRTKELEGAQGMTREIAEGVLLWTGAYDPVRGISAMRTDPADLIW
ncbi:MAG: CRISPR-associated helicase/endonuclease Cas3, partial [Actinobacteria bacterium]